MKLFRKDNICLLATYVNNTVQHLGLRGIAATYQDAACQRILNEFN